VSNFLEPTYSVGNWLLISLKNRIRIIVTLTLELVINFFSQMHLIGASYLPFENDEGEFAPLGSQNQRLSLSSAGKN
jgi:hypothetical protein